MIKKLTAVLILAALIFCGAAAAEGFTSLSVVVLDSTDSHNPLANAQVTIVSDDSTYVQKLYTPLDGDGSVTVMNLPSDKQYTITVSKEGYIAQNKQMSVTPGEKTVSFYLAQETPILVKVVDSTDEKPIADAEITVNGAVAGKTDTFGRLSVPMTRGANNIILVKANSYVPFTETKYISSDETALTIPLSLSETAPLILIYNEAKSPISGAKVSVDGKLVSYSDAYGRAQLPTYTTGVTYEINVSCDGYSDYSDKIEFTAEKTDFIVTLAYAAAPVKVTVKTDSKVLPGAIVYFDGVNKGQTGADGTFTAAANPGTSILITASVDGYNGEEVLCSVEAAKVNEVTILMKENIPTTLIGIGALAVIVILLIVIIGITGYKRSKKATSKKSYAPGQRRDSL
ncbi:MAG TPA: carboxypeptidase regulatory-like domain-containing protein [Methanocorpusculum sp.]|nr:carboxypeptidase regulatory-like domain-containing protein [Methanocorpusculum sp.]